ncbi:MAG: Hpt domain-containing protein [gamma proteobacterium symbiont of Taylorina sp.]|nr:Hpt domain-containing protein [gamma proteobacterium symbiont of Taylorina sp.]
MSANILDLDILNELKEIMEDDFDELIETFILDGQAQLDNLRTATDAQLAADIRSIAHTLKGSSANLGANALSGVCKDLEHNVAVDNLDEIDESFEKIKNEYEAVKMALKENFQ